jgi:hypothetical protein
MEFLGWELECSDGKDNLQDKDLAGVVDGSRMEEIHWVRGFIQWRWSHGQHSVPSW